MKILLTGGAGFIASHIADEYLARGHRVAILDNLSTGFKKNIPRGARFYRADLRNYTAVARILRRERPHIVNHHAALAQVTASLRNPEETFAVNVMGTAHLLRAFGALGAKGKFILASTGGAIYGSPSRLPASEATPAAPLSPYGLSKLLAEETVKFYAAFYGFPHTILRYANVYGPRQNPHGEAGVVAIFGDLMRRGERPLIFGDGTKTRDYVYVGDIARANLAALHKGADETMNIGTGKMTSDLEVFRTLAHAAGFEGTPRFAAYRKGEVYKISLDARRARRVLGWRPTVTFAEGVQRTMQSRD